MLPHPAACDETGSGPVRHAARGPVRRGDPSSTAHVRGCCRRRRVL